MTTDLVVQTPSASPSILMDMGTWNLLREQCTVLAKSTFLPKGVDTPEKAMAIAMKGYELGLPPMAAFAGISIVNGKPVIEGQLMLALIMRVAGANVKIRRFNGDKCEVEGTRPGRDWETYSFSMEDAKKAKLLSKEGPWQTYPDDMLQWRAVARLARAMFSDVLAGTYLPDEMETIDVKATSVSTVASSVQDALLLADKLPEPQNGPQQQPGKVEAPIGDKIQKAHPETVKLLLSKFHEIGLSQEEVLAEIMAKSTEDITTKDIETLRESFKQKKAAKAAVAK